MYVNEYTHSCQTKTQCKAETFESKVYSINLLDKYCVNEENCKEFSTYCTGLGDCPTSNLEQMYWNADEK
jgi:hypothetical protein